MTLCSALAHLPSVPRASEDLFEMYGLTGIALEFARFHPNGEKNALRKTYKGQIKTLGVNGHFDAVKKEPNDPEGLMHFIQYPPEEWHVHEVAGKEIERGFSEQVLSSLLRATTMAKGPVSKSVWDSSVLGDLAPGSVVKKASQEPPRQGAPGTPAASTGGLPKAGKPQLPLGDRSRRNHKKRSYQDSSFDGYGEGFPDDDQGAETGYSTGDNDDRLSKQKRRKQVI